MLRLEYGHRLIQQREYSLRGRHGALQQVEFLGEILKGLEEATGELDECRQYSHRQTAAQRSETAIIQQERHRDRRQHFHHWEEDSVHGDRSEVSLEVLPVKLGETGG